ncbi:hypothetical protein J6590_099616 [Homalodisca vitripennis]|nr:hypothetical protein J6590_035349 [Homalodisca vitripennis]KAG8279683.1 hypothetical protein J6590_099616 [Homalodisca vitripennis]
MSDQNIGLFLKQYLSLSDESIHLHIDMTWFVMASVECVTGCVSPCRANRRECASHGFPRRCSCVSVCGVYTNCVCSRAQRAVEKGNNSEEKDRNRILL